MVEEQLRQVTGIFAVVFGAAGDEGLAILLEGDRIDGKEGDPFIRFQKSNEVDGGLFQAQSDPGLRMVLTKFQEPFPEGLGRGVDGFRAALAGGGGDEVQVGFAIGTIQADDQVEGTRESIMFPFFLLF